jgi:dihydroorotase-like cyclic amidohydrolase
MPQTFDVILKSGTLVNQDGPHAADIGVKDGRIAALGTFESAQAGATVDCKGLHILPGVIDTQVHFREPGLTHKEDLESGSRSAVMGGVTAVFEMPNTDPLTVTAETFADKIKRAYHRMHCDYAFFIGGTHDNYKDLPELERAPGCSGVKVFIGSSTGSLLVPDDDGIRNIMKVIRRRASFHAEDEYRLNDRKHLRIEGDPRSHPVWRDESHRAGIWKGIEQGIVDVLGSDHAPHTLEEKAHTYPHSHSGMTGVQTLVPLMLDHVNAGKLSLARFVDLASAGPARIFNIACKGRIAAGYDADFTVVDMKRSETITNAKVASKAGWTPYDGKRVTGWPVGTFVRGKKVMWEGELTGASSGEAVRFMETLSRD